MSRASLHRHNALSSHRAGGQSQRSRAVALAQQVDVGKTLRGIVIAFLAAALLAVFGVTASGQQPKYEEIPLPEVFNDKNVVKRMEIAARNYAGTGTADERAARYYFQSYVPAKMTQPAALAEMSGLVKNATKLLTQAQRMNNPRSNTILGWVYNGMKKIAEGNYYPPAKINALLVLGRLDEKGADQVGQTPPVPLRYSLPILMAQYNDPANVDGVRAAALQGLHRYVSFKFEALSDEERTTIQTAMTDLLGSPPSAGRSEEAHAYLQRYAVDMLDLLRPQDDPGLGVQLINISTEPTKPNLIALHSAARLGRMSKELQGKVAKPDDVLQSWTARLVTAVEGELARLDAMDRKKTTSRLKQPPRPEEFLENKRAETPTGDRMSMEMGMEMDDMGYEDMMSEMGDYDMGEMEMGDMGMEMGMGYGMMGRGMAPAAKPQPPEVTASRRQLNYVLQSIHVGVTGSPVTGMPRNSGGVLGMVNEQQKPEVEAWVTAMEPIVTAINDEMLDTRKKYVDALTAQLELLQELAGSEAKAVEAEVESIEDLLNAPGPLGVVNQAAPAAAEGNAVAE